MSQTAHSGPRPFAGVLVPALTPFKPDLSPDVDAFVAHCKRLLAQGADGLAVFGTTSEANSLGIDERIELLEALVAHGIPPATLMPGTGTCALTDTIRLTRHAVEVGCSGVLMLPPFYYKGVDDEGLFASYARVIDAVGHADLRVYLYHIPPIAQISLSMPLIGRLLERYPGTVVGIKDSSGDWANTAQILKQYPGLATFCGSEVFLLDTLRNGGAGTITATANINLPAIREVFRQSTTAAAEGLQAGITAVRNQLQAWSAIPALKAVLAHALAQPTWRTVRPPLMPLSDNAAVTLIARLEAVAFGFDVAHEV